MAQLRRLSGQVISDTSTHVDTTRQPACTPRFHKLSPSAIFHGRSLGIVMLTRSLLAEYIETRQNLRGALSPKTIQGYQDSARYAAKYWPPTDLQIQKSLQALRRLSPESERTHLRRLRTIGNYAALAHALPNPYVSVAPRQAVKQQTRVFTPSEYAQLRGACRDITDFAQLDLLFGTGIRIGETPLYVWQVAETHLSISGKTGPRYAAITARDRALLLSTATGDRLWAAPSPFRRPNHGPLSLGGLKANWRALVARSGLSGRKLGPHTARRTFASEYMMNGGTLESLKPLLGHASIRTTEIYAKETPGWVVAQLAKVDPLGNIRRASEANGPEQTESAQARQSQESDSNVA